MIFNFYYYFLGSSVVLPECLVQPAISVLRIYFGVSFCRSSNRFCSNFGFYRSLFLKRRSLYKAGHFTATPVYGFQIERNVVRLFAANGLGSALHGSFGTRKTFAAIFHALCHVLKSRGVGKITTTEAQCSCYFHSGKKY